MSTLIKKIERSGFRPIPTGGGCQAYRWSTDLGRNGTGVEVLVTDASGCFLPDDRESEIIVGVYHEIDGREVFRCTTTSRRDWMAAISRAKEIARSEQRYPSCYSCD